eukprot:2158630-Pyramimonas_sp.AAC.1
MATEEEGEKEEEEEEGKRGEDIRGHGRRPNTKAQSSLRAKYLALVNRKPPGSPAMAGGGRTARNRRGRERRRTGRGEDEEARVN